MREKRRNSQHRRVKSSSMLALSVEYHSSTEGASVFQCEERDKAKEEDTATLINLWFLNTVLSGKWVDFSSNCQILRQVQDYPLPWRKEGEITLIS